jgi:DNA primase
MNVDELTEDQLKQFLRNRGFLDDEIRISFPHESDLRNAVKDIVKLADDSDDSEDFMEGEDDTVLNADQKREVEALEKTRQSIQDRIKEVQKKKKDVKLEASIQDTNSGLTVADVNAAMEEANKLLSEDD